MHGHKRQEQFQEGGPGFGPGFRGWTGDDRFGGASRGRSGGRGRGRGRGDGFGPGFGRHGGFGPGFGGPMFGRGPKVGRGDVRAAIIALLAEEPMHGYQIITELTERSGGVWRPSPGSVYPTLQVMEDQGLVTADKSEGRRVFSLTDEGRAAADAAGDGPAPWEEAARGADRSLVDLRGLMGELMSAIMQVGQAGSDQQVKAVGEILSETRRRIYLVLANGADGDPATGRCVRASAASGSSETSGTLRRRQEPPIVNGCRRFGHEDGTCRAAHPERLGERCAAPTEDLCPGDRPCPVRRQARLRRRVSRTMSSRSGASTTPTTRRWVGSAG